MNRFPLIEGVRMGSLDASVAHVANASTVVPELALFSVPYLFKDRDHYERVLGNPKFHDRIDALFAGKNLGLRVIGYYSAGVRTLYTRRGPATTPEALKGTKIRVMNLARHGIANRPHIKTHKIPALGKMQM